MIKDEIIVKRYADAFVSFLKETIGLQKGLRDLTKLKDSVIRDSPEFLRFLESMDITYSEKSDFIDKIIKEGFPAEIRHFLKLLLRKERIDKLVDIMDYIRITYSNMAVALLRVSFPLDLKVVKVIENKLEEKFNKKFKFYIELDGELMGGVQVIIGNTVIDNSVRRHIDELRGKLMTLRV